MLNPTPSPKQFALVAEIIGTDDFDEVENRLGSLDDDNWQLTIEDVEVWKTIRNKFNVIDVDGVKINKDRDRLAITNRVRTRLGYAKVDVNGNEIGGDLYDSANVPVSIW